MLKIADTHTSILSLVFFFFSFSIHEGKHVTLRFVLPLKFRSFSSVPIACNVVALVRQQYFRNVSVFESRGVFVCVGIRKIIDNIYPFSTC